MTDDLFDKFDAWEPLFKARKAKGLDKWERLKNISEKLQGKDVRAISFTCAHPSHGGAAVKHLLGSVEGNLHFLLGYGNPKFHLAPYHWQIIDPNITDEEAVEMSARMNHPANVVLWSKSGLVAEDEGDISEGDPHGRKVTTATKKEKGSDGIKVRSAAGVYICYPSEGLVYGEHNGHYYTFDLVKDTFFAAQNPEVVEAMSAADTLKSMNGVVFRTGIPSALRDYTRQFAGETFADEVWPLVKSKMPVPGKILKLENSYGETMFGVTTPTTLEFFDRAANKVSVQLFDRKYDHFDLVRDGNVPPASLFSLLNKHFKINKALLSEVTAPSKAVAVTKGGVFSVEGTASPGWDDVPADGEDFQKAIVVDGDVLKVVRV